MFVAGALLTLVATSREFFLNLGAFLASTGNSAVGKLRVVLPFVQGNNTTANDNLALAA
jgi:hypothetical protein